MDKATNPRSRNFFWTCLSYSGEITAVAAAVFLVAVGTFGLQESVLSEIAAIGFALVINIMQIKRNMHRAHKPSESELQRLRGISATLAHRLDVQSTLIGRLLDEAAPNIEVEVLETPYDFYRALNAAREESSKTIKVMKLHHLGPKDADRDVQLESASQDVGVSVARAEMDRWYNGLSEWNRKPGRLVERVATCPSDSMRKFIAEAATSMRGTVFRQHILPWDGELPLLNLCVFDEAQVIITFSTREWENPYKPVPGLRIKSAPVARFFKERYYDRVVEYCYSGSHRRKVAQ